MLWCDHGVYVDGCPTFAMEIPRVAAIARTEETSDVASPERAHVNKMSVGWEGDCDGQRGDVDRVVHVEFGRVRDAGGVCGWPLGVRLGVAVGLAWSSKREQRRREKSGSAKWR